MQDTKVEKDCREFQCKNCKIALIISAISLAIAISCILVTTRFGNQLNEQKIRFEDELVSVKSFVIGLGLLQSPNLDLTTFNQFHKDNSDGDMVQSRTKRSLNTLNTEIRKQSELIQKMQKALLAKAKFSSKVTQDPCCNKTVICVGRRGRRGKAGRRGPKGDQGEIGLPGPRGPAGIQGDKGEYGKSGPKGDRGYMGQPGKTGPAGVQGKNEGEGPRGPKGDQGDMGPAGMKGEKGDAGPRGPPGLTIEKARITLGPANATMVEGSTATFSCEATGYPKPEIRWSRNNVQLRRGFGNYVKIGNTGLGISHLSPSYDGTVTCIADNVIGKDEASAKLVVLTKPTVKTFPERLLASSGRTYEVRCTATGFPLPTISWRKSGGKMPSDAKVKPDGTLEFQNIQKSDSGTYSCTAKSSVASAEAAVTIIVHDVKYKDCKEIFTAGYKDSGMYAILMADGTQLDVYCDMKTDGGGWTVFQRRVNASVNFYRGWDEYKRGFGDLNGNFWLGLDNIHRLTTAGTSLRVDMKNLQGLKGFTKYDKFQVGSEQSKYKLNVAGFTGNASDSLSYHNKMIFITKDSGTRQGTNCAGLCQGAWWYNVRNYPYACHRSNLNGIYPRRSYSGSDMFMSWYRWENRYGSIYFSEMKLRRNN